LAGHDRSDGGLATTLLEMAFAGNCGLDVDLTPLDQSRASSALADKDVSPALATLFNEEVKSNSEPNLSKWHIENTRVHSATQRCYTPESLFEKLVCSV